MAGTHRQLESLPGYDRIKQNISNSELHALSLTHHLLFIRHLSKWNCLHGHPSQDCQLLLPFLQHITSFSQFHLLDMTSSLSGSILVQLFIVSLLGSTVNSIFVSLPFILYIFVTSLNYGFESVASLHKILDISHCPLSKLLHQAPAYLSSSFFHHLSLFPSYNEGFLVLCSAHLYSPLWNVH